jgi:hypothetical protein
MKSGMKINGAYGKTTVAQWVALSLLTLSSPLSVFGALGDSTSSVLVDQARMKASLRIVQESTYTVHEMKSPNGTVVREYVSQSDERVFGVTWQGPTIPDLKQLLGTYFQRYSEAAKSERESRVGRRPLNVQKPGLIVQTAGHMGAFSGRAYDPELLPAGVDAKVIQ